MNIQKNRRSPGMRRTETMLKSPDIKIIASMASEATGEENLLESIDISVTLLTRVKQMLENGGTIVTDTPVLLDQLDSSLISGTNAVVRCFLEEPEVVKLAERKMTSKAEVAVDAALSLSGPKLMVIGTAPTALARILRRRQTEPLTDVYIVTGVSGFASAVSLKEKLRETNMTYGMIRGKSGGVIATAALLNSIIKATKQN